MNTDIVITCRRDPWRWRKFAEAFFQLATRKLTRSPVNHNDMRFIDEGRDFGAYAKGWLEIIFTPRKPAEYWYVGINPKYLSGEVKDRMKLQATLMKGLPYDAWAILWHLIYWASFRTIALFTDSTSAVMCSEGVAVVIQEGQRWLVPNHPERVHPGWFLERAQDPEDDRYFLCDINGKSL